MYIGRFIHSCICVFRDIRSKFKLKKTKPSSPRQKPKTSIGSTTASITAAATDRRDVATDSVRETVSKPATTIVGPTPARYFYIHTF